VRFLSSRGPSPRRISPQVAETRRPASGGVCILNSDESRTGGADSDGAGRGAARRTAALRWRLGPGEDGRDAGPAGAGSPACRSAAPGGPRPRGVAVSRATKGRAAKAGGEAGARRPTVPRGDRGAGQLGHLGAAIQADPQPRPAGSHPRPAGYRPFKQPGSRSGPDHCGDRGTGDACGARTYGGAAACRGAAVRPVSGLRGFAISRAWWGLGLACVDRRTSGSGSARHPGDPSVVARR
jgi:hypothetical protein